MKKDAFKLSLPDDITFAQLNEERTRGSKFIFFIYLIPRPWSPVKRISRVYFIRPDDKISKINKKYNFITLLWGWWGLPLGPVITYKTIQSNRTGIDITDDVYDNLGQGDFEKRKVVIRKASTIFLQPSKDIIQEFLKGFKKWEEKGVKLTEEPIVGDYIDTEESYYVIGLNKLDLDKSENIREALYRYFLPRTKFEFIDLNEESEITEKLKMHGIKINILKS
ncbi:hypothetical protein GCM10011506_14190 [Marivirga lumbricoides]|uniref:Uncharacterized protein n=1 Tax=Marivirga lumbricoides TaxID=1046115 RepID=A0ABQ1LTV5_9BACT|nr:hypothetical protein GCM10011506_14190 [Marivirga lumbricoides]